MERAPENALNYIESMSDSQSDIVSNIRLFGLDTVLTNKLKRLDRRAHMRGQMSRLMQKRLNQVLERDSRTLRRVQEIGDQIGPLEGIESDQRPI